MNDKMKSLRSPLGKVRGLGSAHNGTEEWINLRLTALALVPLSIYVLTGFVDTALSGGYSGAVSWLHSPLSASVTILTLLAGLHHGAAGIREVADDYLHCHVVKISALFLVNFVAFALAVIGTLSVAKIFFGV
jgi:succinate dehydrogenase / fumarate reductase membrane anchor subunit